MISTVEEYQNITVRTLLSIGHPAFYVNQIVQTDFPSMFSMLASMERTQNQAKIWVKGYDKVSKDFRCRSSGLLMKEPAITQRNRDVDEFSYELGDDSESPLQSFGLSQCTQPTTRDFAKYTLEDLRVRLQDGFESERLQEIAAECLYVLDEGDYCTSFFEAITASQFSGIIQAAHNLQEVSLDPPQISTGHYFGTTLVRQLLMKFTEMFAQKADDRRLVLSTLQKCNLKIDEEFASSILNSITDCDARNDFIRHFWSCDTDNSLQVMTSGFALQLASDLVASNQEAEAFDLISLVSQAEDSTIAEQVEHFMKATSWSESKYDFLESQLSSQTAVVESPEIRSCFNTFSQLLIAERQQIDLVQEERKLTNDHIERLEERLKLNKIKRKTDKQRILNLERKVKSIEDSLNFIVAQLNTCFSQEKNSPRLLNKFGNKLSVSEFVDRVEELAATKEAFDIKLVRMEDKIQEVSHSIRSEVLVQSSEYNANAISSYKVNSNTLYTTAIDTLKTTEVQVNWVFLNGSQLALLPDNALFVTGGSVSQKTAMIIGDTTVEKEPMLTAREWHGSVFYEDYVYVLGGWGGSSYLANCERYNLTSKSWTSLPDMPTATSGINPIVIEPTECLYVLGGYNGEYLDLLQELNLKNLTWRLLALNLPNTDSFIMTFKVKKISTELFFVQESKLMMCMPQQSSIIKVATIKADIKCSTGLSTFVNTHLLCSQDEGPAHDFEVGIFTV